MSLTRLFPTPSDRMSIMWTLMPVEDAVVLEYGPAGTTHFGNGLYMSLGIRTENHIYTTHISEDDVIMGDVSRLEAAMEEIDEAYGPRAIFVVGSASIAVIGTDVKGVCSYMQERVKARLIAFDDGGFRGEYSFGLKAAYTLLARELVRETKEKDPDSYVILGASLGEYRCRSDIWEVQNLMEEAFGMRCRCCFGLEGKLQDFEEAGQASLALVLRPEAKEAAATAQEEAVAAAVAEANEAAAILEEKASVPSCYGAPYGYEGTLSWLERISGLLNRPVNTALLQRIRFKMRRNGVSMGGPMGSIRLKEPRAVLQGDYERLLGLQSALKEMHIPTEAMICMHSLKSLAEPAAGVVHYAKEKERIRHLRNLQDCWLLGSAEMEQLCDGSNYFTCAGAPFSGYSQIATHLPFMGEKGMDYLMEQADRYFEKSGI